MVFQVADFPEHIQNKLHGFLWQKKLPPPSDILVTIDEKPLTKVKEKRVLGVIIDENLSFIYIPHWTNNKKKKMQNSLQQVNSTSRTITTSSITTVQSLHKNQTRVWMHYMGSHHPHRKINRCLTDINQF